MKDLDKTQVYDLRGITEEQAKELHRWLCKDDEVWRGISYRWLREGFSLEYYSTEWARSGGEPTTHILTLFGQSYEEQQLQEAKKKLDHYKKEVERLESKLKPKINDVCKFWDYNSDDFLIGILTSTNDSKLPYKAGESNWFKNAKKLTEQEVIDLLFNKSC